MLLAVNAGNSIILFGFSGIILSDLLQNGRLFGIMAVTKYHTEGLYESISFAAERKFL